MFVSVILFGNDEAAPPCLCVSLLSEVISGALNFELLTNFLCHLHHQIYLSDKNSSFRPASENNVQVSVCHGFISVVSDRSYTCINTSNATLSSGISWNIPGVFCIFSVYTRTFRRVCIPSATVFSASVYNEKIQATSGMFHGMSR